MSPPADTRRRGRPLPLPAALAGALLAGCGAVATAPQPFPGRFPVCYNHTCATVQEVTLTPPQWESIRALFAPPPADAAAERRRIATAIARMEQMVGTLTGTGGDLGGNFKGLGRPGQMDCIDESTNTTTYLRLMAAARLLRFHDVEERATRGFFILGWPHSTAVVRERASGVDYAVDSWFFDNGIPPAILPLDEWRGGWEPPEPEPPGAP